MFSSSIYSGVGSGVTADISLFLSFASTVTIIVFVLELSAKIVIVVEP